MKTIIYHNPMCSKSREALETVKQQKGEVEVIEYLKTQPSVQELKEIVDMLGIRPEELIRKSEEIYRDNFKGKILTDEEWLQAMVDFPKLIERPIVIRGNKAVIGRPVEKVIELLK